MIKPLLRILILCSILAVALALALGLALLFHGSLEAFPTVEQHEKARLASGVMVLALAAAETALVLLLRRLRP